jgi:hypothetical protein
MSTRVFGVLGLMILFILLMIFHFVQYTKAVLKFPKLDTQAQQREAVVQGRSLSPYRLRYIWVVFEYRSCAVFDKFFGGDMANCLSDCQ